MKDHVSLREVVRVFIASPAEASTTERHAVFDILSEWNSLNSHRVPVVFVASMWETGLRSGFAQSAQDQINVDLLDNCDLLIAVFGRTLGAPRDVLSANHEDLYASVEELFRAMNGGKDAWAYFSDTERRGP